MITANRTDLTAGNSENACDETMLVWRLHLLRQQPGRLPVILCAALFAGTVGWMLSHNLLFSVAAIFMIASATIDYFLPINYVLTTDAAHCKFGPNDVELKWDRLSRALVYPDGIRLSPLPNPSRLDNFRGVFLRFAPDGQPGDRESLIDALGRLRPSPVPPERP